MSNNAPRVFVVQVPSFYDAIKKKWRPKYDIEPASQFGELITILKPGNISDEEMTDIYQHVKAKMVGLNFNENDYILGHMGDPVATALVFIIASQLTDGNTKMLKFNKRLDNYVEVPLKTK